MRGDNLSAELDSPKADYRALGIDIGDEVVLSVAGIGRTRQWEMLWLVDNRGSFTEVRNRPESFLVPPRHFGGRYSVHVSSNFE